MKDFLNSITRFSTMTMKKSGSKFSKTSKRKDKLSWKLPTILPQLSIQTQRKEVLKKILSKWKRRRKRVVKEENNKQDFELANGSSIQRLAQFHLTVAPSLKSHTVEKVNNCLNKSWPLISKTEIHQMNQMELFTKSLPSPAFQESTLTDLTLFSRNN